jgi:hypothetical protein
LGNLFIPKGVHGEGYGIRCVIGAYNNSSGEAYVYMELKEKVRQVQLNAAINDTGASSVIFNTFSADRKGMKSTYDEECAAALFSVHKQSKEPGFVLISKGIAWVEPKEMIPIPEVDKETSVEHCSGMDINNDFSIHSVCERAKRIRSVDAADVLDLLMRQEKRQTFHEMHLSSEHEKETEKINSRYEKIIDRYENNAQVMEAKIKELEAFNKELKSKNDMLMHMVETSVPNE